MIPVMKAFFIAVNVIVRTCSVTPSSTWRAIADWSARRCGGRCKRATSKRWGGPRRELDLRDRDATFDAVLSARPQVMVMAAARVGGIMANATHPVDFLNDNLRIQTNLFEAAHAAEVERVVFLGSSCIYPKLAPQPIPESALLPGPLEPTNQAYAIAKIAGIEAVKSYRRQYGRRWISAMPTNLYGPGDNFDLNSSHVLPAMIRKFHEADDRVTLWGTGSPRREFLHSDDAASAILHLIEHYDGDEHVNVGTGEDISIRELAELVAEVVGFDGPDRVGHIQAGRDTPQVAGRVPVERAWDGGPRSACGKGSQRHTSGSQPPDAAAQAFHPDPPCPRAAEALVGATVAGSAGPSSPGGCGSREDLNPTGGGPDHPPPRARLVPRVFVSGISLNVSPSTRT